ncbi:MAG: phosphoenolpyruvate synthase [Candidatus Aegiribacteria sp.]
MHDSEYVKWFSNIAGDDVDSVGGKNASLGEMIRELGEKGINVPRGFATTSKAYRRFLEHNRLTEKISEELEKLRQDDENLSEVGERVREMMRNGEFPEEMESEIRKAYRELSRSMESEEVDVAVRSSATAEDLPEASFAGQQDSFLNVTGEENLLLRARDCYASLFTDRAISYRENAGFDHMDVALSVGIHKMIGANEKGGGVMFTLDTETGFPDVVLINAAWGIPDTVVSGEVQPDEYRVFKPHLERDGLSPVIMKRPGGAKIKEILTDDPENPTKKIETSKEERSNFVLDEGEILQLARWGVVIEEHYGRPMDIEWATDADSGELYVVQARPETVQSGRKAARISNYSLEEEGNVLVEGLAIGASIGAGRTFVMKNMEESDRFEDDGVLVTDMTDPDWVPLMKRASAIVTDHGGRTSHAAIVSRELGVPAVVGTGEATEKLSDGDEITVSCAGGTTGKVYSGILEFSETEIDQEDLPDTETDIMMIMASPDAAFRWWNLPVDGIGLARMEFIINNHIKIHPLALTRFDDIEDDRVKERIQELTLAYDDREEYFVDRLSRGIATIAAPHYPGPVVVRLSDFKTNEYADLIGGSQFEPGEANPMLGFRGAFRYTHQRYSDGFALECAALKRARERIGMDNIVAMVPFCRTVGEADSVLDAMAENGLKRGENGFRVYVMAEVPSNVILADEFAKRFDGFSIGSNDLTQLVLGVDRDSDVLQPLFDERDDAVKTMIRQLIDRAHDAGLPVGICGQAPSDHPDFAAFLVEAGIDSISVNPDSVVEVRKRVAEAEGMKRRD